jgi:hypothetical protein
MNFDNGTNLDRKSRVRGLKKTGQAPPNAFCWINYEIVAGSEKAIEAHRFRPTYSGFPVEVGGIGELHAAFLNESRTRGCVWCCVTGSPDTLGRTWGTRPFLIRSS